MLQNTMPIAPIEICPAERITNIEPYSGGVAAADKDVAKERWDKIEDAAIRAQGKPSFED